MALLKIYNIHTYVYNANKSLLFQMNYKSPKMLQHILFNILYVGEVYLFVLGSLYTRKGFDIDSFPLDLKINFLFSSFFVVH